MSLRLRLYSAITRVTLKSVLKRNRDVKFIRKHVERLGRTSFRQMSGAVVTKIKLSAGNQDVSALKVELGENLSDGAVLYIHGGGFIFGSPHLYRHMVADLSGRLNVPVYVPQYGLAPERPFPEGLDDVKASYRALLDMGIDPQKIVIGGDSAGGNLTLALLAYLVGANLPLPACSFVLSPVVDLTYSSASIGKNAWTDAVLPANQSEFIRELYLRGKDTKNPAASPIFANFHGMTPILFHACTKEILYDETVRMVAELKRQNVDVECKYWNTGYHVFHLLRGRVPEADQAMSEISEFALRHMPSDPTDS